jgi:hypothetical protein
MNNGPVTMQDVLKRLAEQEGINRQFLGLTQQIAASLGSMTSTQASQTEQLAMIARWIASQPK